MNWHTFTQTLWDKNDSIFWTISLDTPRFTAGYLSVLRCVFTLISAFSSEFFTDLTIDIFQIFQEDKRAEKSRFLIGKTLLLAHNMYD